MHCLFEDIGVSDMGGAHYPLIVLVSQKSIAKSWSI